MAYFNWKDRKIQPRIDPVESAADRWRMALTMVEGEWGEFLQGLEGLSREEFQEFRVDLPGDWILFCKVRPLGSVESRLLVAHPQEEQWVASLSLSRSHLEALIERMRLDLGELKGNALHFSSIAEERGVKIGHPSNLEVMFIRG